MKWLVEESEASSCLFPISTVLQICFLKDIVSGQSAITIILTVFVVQNQNSNYKVCLGQFQVA